jgi:hypothetical protein
MELCLRNNTRTCHHYTKLMYVGWRSSLRNSTAYLSSMLRLSLFNAASNVHQFGIMVTYVVRVLLRRHNSMFMRICHGFNQLLTRNVCFYLWGLSFNVES